MCPDISIVTVALKIAVETGAADPKDLRGAEPVAVTHLQHFLDVVLTHFVEREWLPILVAGDVSGPVLQVFRQIAQVDEIARGSDASGRNYILKFANISGPGML